MDYSFVWAGIAAFVLMLMFGAIGLPVLRKMNARQEVREEGPKSHRQKSGTPTMGGILLLPAAILATLYFTGMNEKVLWVLFLVVGHGLLGLADDSIKAIMKRNLGLTARQKLLGQFLLAGVFCYASATWLHLPTTLHVPFINSYFDIGNIYYLLIFLVIVGTTNAVNLTDGLDGLAVGTSAIAFAAYVWLARGMEEMSIAFLAAAFAGACIGFLVYNYHPAKMFMGDTGSLALGGAFAGMAILTKTELLLVIIGGIFVVEALSVILQVLSFKLRGKRVFRMSPIHHHFELGGWSETKVVHVFWLVGIVLALVGVMGA